MVESRSTSPPPGEGFLFSSALDVDENARVLPAAALEVDASMGRILDGIAGGMPPRSIKLAAAAAAAGVRESGLMVAGLSSCLSLVACFERYLLG